MPNTIQRIVPLVTLLTWLVSHAPTFAIEPSAYPAQQNDFFNKNKQFPLHIGVKGWAKWSKKVIEQHWAIGVEMAIGPIIEWQPLNGIGIQTGWLYSYNYFFTVPFAVDRNKILDTGLISFGRYVMDEVGRLCTHYKNDTVDSSLDSITFHAFSFPLSFRFYPEKTRQLVLYIGPRFILMLPGAKKDKVVSMHIDPNNIKNIVKRGLRQVSCSLLNGVDVDIIQNIVEETLSDMLRSIFQSDANGAKNQNGYHKMFSCDWDVGFEFKGKAGFIIGINGLGLVLGYNYIK